MPSAWSTAIGSTAPWTDQEKNVCSRDSAAISALVMELDAVVMPMGHLGADAACAGAGRMSIGRRSGAVRGRHYSTTVDRERCAPAGCRGPAGVGADRWAFRSPARFGDPG